MSAGNVRSISESTQRARTERLFEDSKGTSLEKYDQARLAILPYAEDLARELVRSLSPDLAAGHRTDPLLGTILVESADPAAVARRVRALAPRYPGVRVSDRASLATVADADREVDRWLGPLFVGIIFAFTSIAVVNTLAMIALQRRRELALLRLAGGTPGQVRSMARWEAALVIAMGLGLGLAIAATALLPLSHALTGTLRPHVPLDQLAAILGTSALLALLALALPTRRALRSRPVEAIGMRD